MKTVLQKAKNYQEKCTKSSLLTVEAANKIMKKYLYKLHTVLVTHTDWL